MSSLNPTEIFLRIFGLYITSPCTWQRTNNISVLVSSGPAGGVEHQQNQLPPLSLVIPALGFPWVKRAPQPQNQPLLQTLGWLERDFFTIKSSKYSPYFSHFAYHSLDCLYQSITCLPLGLTDLPSHAPSVFSLLNKLFCKDFFQTNCIGFKD